MIPERPLEIPVGSREDEMFLALSGLSDEYYVFHSFVIVNTSDGIIHESETDFMIFHPQKGILCLEAKAGEISCDEGIWKYRSGTTMKHGGPFKQADANKWKLMKLFERRGLKHLWNKCKTLHAVWFPSVDRAYINSLSLPADADKNLILTRESLDNIEQDVEKMFTVQLENNLQTSLNANEVERILRSILCPTFNLIPSITSELSIKKRAFNRLLTEQANILDFLEEQPFAIISGVAGTGKTMIALEKSRRHSEDNEKVLFLCFNRKLCEFLRENYKYDNVSFYTIDGFACSICGTQTADFGVLESKLMELYINEAFPYKHVIIDEGQDFGQERIEETNIIQMLEDIVLSENVDGSFYFFYDKNQLIQGFQLPRYITDSDCKLTLYKNCRNTKIVAETSIRPLGQGAKPKKFKCIVDGGSSDLFIHNDSATAKESLDKALSELLQKNIKDIYILSCSTESDSFLSDYIIDGKYLIGNSRINFTTCRKFKGLEADAIILVDVTKETFFEDNKLFYVGASRARFFLTTIAVLTEDDCNEIVASLGYPSRNKPLKDFAMAMNSRYRKTV